jgi:hypothetical protein
MITRTLGSSGLEVSAIGLSLAVFQPGVGAGSRSEAGDA